MVALLALVASGTALAQAPPPQPGLVERLAPTAPPALGPAMAPPAPERVTGPGATRRIQLGAIDAQGGTALPPATIAAILDPLRGTEVALAAIEDARIALLHAYRAAGYPYVAVAATLSPAPGAPRLVFRITEAAIAGISIEGEIGPAEILARRMLAPLVGQRPIPHDALERALLLLSDIPGVTAQGVLRPVAGEPGALELAVRLTRRPVAGYLNIDNRGYVATGRWQALGVAQVNAQTRFGERTELAAVWSEANNQNFLQATQEVFLGASGLRLRAWAGLGRAAPGAPLAAIGYAGDTQLAGVALSYPLLRSRPLNVTLTGGIDAFDSVVEARDAPELMRTRRSRDAVRAVRAGIEGAVLDGWAGLAPAAAATNFHLRLHRGLEAFGASDGGAGTAARFGSDFGFAKLTAEVSRLQPLALFGSGWMLAAQGTLAGQWSDDALPPAEKFFLGGNRLGRGFYAGQVAGDRAAAIAGELQLGRIGALPWGGADAPRLGTQAYLFRDEGRAADNGAGGTVRRLASFGAGVRLQMDEHAQLDAELARRITRTPEGTGVTPLREDAVFVRLLLRF